MNIFYFLLRYDEATRLRHADKEQIDHLTGSIGDASAEINLLRQRFKSLGDELSRLTKDNGRLWDELQKARGVRFINKKKKNLINLFSI